MNAFPNFISNRNIAFDDKYHPWINEIMESKIKDTQGKHTLKWNSITYRTYEYGQLGNCRDDSKLFELLPFLHGRLSFSVTWYMLSRCRGWKPHKMFAFGTGKTLGIVNFYSNYWLIITLVNRGFNANRILMTLHCKAQLQLVTKHVNCDSVSYSKSLNRKKFDIVLKHIHLKMTVVTPYFLGNRTFWDF